MSRSVVDAALSRRSLVKWSMIVPAAAMLPIRLHGASAKEIVATMVTDTNGLGDQNFNDLANKGGNKAATDLGISWKVIESSDAASFVPNLTAGAEQSDLTVAVGFNLADAIKAVAAQYPDKNFLHIDNDSQDQPNIQGVLFKENEPAFLVGLVAGKLTKSNVIGIVGGQAIPPVVRYEVGFRAGIMTTNPAADVKVTYADTFSDPVTGQKIGTDQISLGADILFPIAGGTGAGAYAAAKEKGPSVWMISADTSQNQLDPGQELCVAQKGVDTEVYEGIKQVVDGTFKGGTRTLGLKEGAVSIQDPNKLIPADVMAIVTAFQQQIIDGTLAVPVDYDTLKAFKAPAVPSGAASPAASPEGTPAA
jgi:basic membrane protein A